MNRKWVAQMFERGSGDGNGVKPDVRFIRAGAANVVPGRPAESMHLGRIDIPLGRAQLAGSARFDLDEYQQIALPGDDIDLATALRRAPVARHDDEPIAPQIPVRKILAAPSGVTVLAVANGVGDPVQGRQRVQIRTPWLCRAPDSRDRTPRISGSAETGLQEIRSPAISRTLVA